MVSFSWVSTLILQYEQSKESRGLSQWCLTVTSQECYCITNHKSDIVCPKLKEHIVIHFLSDLIVNHITQSLMSDISLHWRHNDHDGVSNQQPHGCLLNRLFKRRSKKRSKLRVTGPCAGNSPGPVNSLHKWPVTRKMLPFDDVIMCYVGSYTTVTSNALYFVKFPFHSTYFWLYLFELC